MSEIVLHQKEDGTMQLRDSTSFLFCACSKPAVEQVTQNIEPYVFMCAKCYKEWLR